MSPVEEDVVPEGRSSSASSSSAHHAPVPPSSAGVRPASAPTTTGGDESQQQQQQQRRVVRPSVPPPSLRPIRTAPASSASSSCDYPPPGNNNAGGGGDCQNVRVVARLRPLSAKEKDEGSCECIGPSESRGMGGSSKSKIVEVRPSSSSSSSSFEEQGGHRDSHEGSGGGGKREFEFDGVFGPNSTQEEVYEGAVGDMISSSVFRGFNATILAYGQTGSGKTFTMGTDGSGSSDSGEDNDDEMIDDAPPSATEGVIGRAVRDLFRARRSLPNGERRVSVTMSYLEIYNEKAIDLLNDNDPNNAGSQQTTLQVRDHPTEGVIVPGLRRVSVSSPGEVTRRMEEASGRRATASTHMNAVSSRSHAVCTLTVAIAPDDTGGEGAGTAAGSEGGGTDEEGGSNGEATNNNNAVVVSPRSASQGMRAKLTLVDLAGSERIKRTGAEGARMKEGININKGLFVLGQVVSALSELGQRNNNNNGSGGGGHHIPYRDSKLTRLLQDSLGGNSRTVMIACISPAESNAEESINTLRYAERTRNIKNSAVRNVVSSGLSASEAAALRRENQQLKLELARMESRMIVSGNRGSGGGAGDNGFSFSGGGFIATNDKDTETATQLQAQCSSLLAEVDLLKGRDRNRAQEVLEASLRADKWQATSEAVTRLAKEQGVALPEETADVSSENDIVFQLRNQLAECKAELLEARTEAAVARATAGAVIAGNGDLDGIEETIMNSEDAMALPTSPSKEEQAHNEQLTTELSSVSATIEQKEAMVMQMNKERACMDNLQHHFENSLKLLQTEVDALTAERDELVVKISADNAKDADGSDTQKRRRRKANDPVTKRLRDQISKLEGRIDDLKLKAGEHKKSLKMKEEAQKKCARLMSDIAEDKRRRADLQRKLKETSVEMRAEKKAARLKAARMMKDSQKLKIELTKMKSAAKKQAAVLKRKIDQASAKEKARAELARKRRSAERTRLASTSGDNSDVREERKVELASWIDRELEYSSIKFQIDQQRRQLDRSIAERKKLRKNSGDAEDAEELGQLDVTIQSLRATVQDLEQAVKKAFPAVSEGIMASNFRFLEMDTFKALSKPDAKYVMSYVFDGSCSAKREMASVISDQESATKARVDSALAKEHQVHEKELMKVNMEHAQDKLNLLESTQGTLNSNIKIKMDSAGTEEELKAQVNVLLATYNESWTSAAEGLKSDLDVIREAQEDLQTMMDNMTKGMTLVSKKSKAKKVKKTVEYESDEFLSDDDSVQSEDRGDDGEWEPTKTKAQLLAEQKRRSPRLAKKAAAKKATAKKAMVPDSPSSPIGEDFIDDIDNKRVGSLKKACKKLGVPVTGKKADLKQRVRETFLNSSSAILNSSVMEMNDESLSPLKKVMFDGGVSADPEFQPIEEQPTSTESIKKQLWQHDTDVDSKDSKCKTSSEAPIKLTSCLTQTMTPFKRKKSPASEKENDTPKRLKPVKSTTTSPLRPLSSHNSQRTPVHMKQTIATAQKRLVPDKNQSAAVTKRNISMSTKKRNKKGMANAVAQALQQNRGLF